jgi:hypothetical protein
MAYLPLSTANLPDPVIDPATGATPDQHFGTLLWSGDDNATRTIQAGGTGVTGDINFTPDFAWIKRRNGATNGSDHMLLDAVRGVGSFNALSSNGTQAEGFTAAGSNWINFGDIDAFTTDGFTVQKGSDPSHTLEGINETGGTYVAWNWKAGTSFSNSAGTNGATVASNGSVNTTSGFSIVRFNSGASGTQSFKHGLEQRPDLCIFKEKDSGGAGDHWVVWEGVALNPAQSYGYLNLTNGFANDASQWSNTAPTSSIFTYNSGYAWSTSQEMIAYCFHSVEGFSKFGSYVGNGSTDGPFVYTGFRPAWILWKRTDAAQEWHIMDVERNTYNPLGKDLWPPHSSAEYDYGTVVDYTSNGFKLRTSSVIANASGGTYIYMAFAENPFKYSNAR